MSKGSYGVNLGYSTTTPAGTYTALTGIVDLDDPKMQRSTWEDKSLDQADLYIKKKGSFINPGQSQFKLVHTNAAYTILKGLLENVDPVHWQITLPKEAAASASGAKHQFDGILTDLGMPFPDDGGRLVCECTIEVSGGITIVDEV